MIKNYFLDLFQCSVNGFRFYTAYRMCIEAVVLNLQKLGENLRCRKSLERLLPISEFGSRQRFLYRDRIFLGTISRHGSLCRDIVHKL